MDTPDRLFHGTNLFVMIEEIESSIEEIRDRFYNETKDRERRILRENMIVLDEMMNEILWEFCVYKIYSGLEGKHDIRETHDRRTAKMLNQRSNQELAEIAVDLGDLDSSHIDFVQKLNNWRNSVAHNKGLSELDLEEVQDNVRRFLDLQNKVEKKMKHG